MLICTVGHSFRYEMEKLCRLFYPFEKIEFSDDYTPTDFCAVTVLSQRENGADIKTELYINGEKTENSCFDEKSESFLDDCERKMAVLLFTLLSERTGITPEWGILTGVRPAKLYRKLEAQGGELYASEYFKNELKVKPHKINLCAKTAASEDEIVSLSGERSFSLYVSVPFCPSRCSYCSFVSHSVDKAKKLIPEYFEKLIEEINVTGNIARNLGLKLETVYVGGGTPTTLSAEQLSTLTDTLHSSFDMDNIREFTVEAGRPDTVTREKLVAISRGGATRISINPQTFNDRVLEIIGRKHTAADTVNAFNLARDVGFDNINMDLIAGLPEDSFESFCNTLDKVLLLDPENVTVHSLSLKRASGMNKNGDLPEKETGKIAADMVRHASNVLSGAGIFPYYMYRQSKTVGNLENVGYAKVGFEGLYNVYIMDETHTILACGASGVTKLKQPNVNNIERLYNFKYPYEYINRFDEIISRKKGIGEFYDKYCKFDK